MIDVKIQRTFQLKVTYTDFSSIFDSEMYEESPLLPLKVIRCTLNNNFNYDLIKQTASGLFLIHDIENEKIIELFEA